MHTARVLAPPTLPLRHFGAYTAQTMLSPPGPPPADRAGPRAASTRSERQWLSKHLESSVGSAKWRKERKSPPHAGELRDVRSSMSSQCSWPMRDRLGLDAPASLRPTRHLGRVGAVVVMRLHRAPPLEMVVGAATQTRRRAGSLWHTCAMRADAVPLTSILPARCNAACGRRPRPVSEAKKSAPNRRHLTSVWSPR